MNKRTTTHPATPAAPALALAVRRARERFLGGRPPGEDVPDDARRGVATGPVPRRTAGSDAASPPTVPAHSPLLTPRARCSTASCPPWAAAARRWCSPTRAAGCCGRAATVPGRSAPAAGSDLSERAVGHNSAVLALRLGAGPEIHGPEHVLDRVAGAVGGQRPAVRAGGGPCPAGTVTALTGLREDRAPHPGAALAEATALAVETELRTGPGPRSGCCWTRICARRRRGRGAVAGALDGSSRIVSSGAARLLSDETLTRWSAGPRRCCGTRGRRTGGTAGVPGAGRCRARRPDDTGRARGRGHRRGRGGPPGPGEAGPRRVRRDGTAGGPARRARPVRRGRGGCRRRGRPGWPGPRSRCC